MVGIKGMKHQKSTLAAVRRRQDKVVEWTLQRYSVEQIARSLRPPVRTSTVSADRSARTDQLPLGPRAYVVQRTSSRPDPEPFDWATPPLPERKPAYLLNAPLTRAEGLLTALRESNALARLPHNIAEAAAEGDEEWITHREAVLEALIGYLQRMLDVFQDDHARQAALKPAARDDLLTPKQRALLARTEGRRDRSVITGANVGKLLPEKGDGTLPTRVFQVLMGYHFAGMDILSDEVTDAIVLREHATPGRVQEAARELKPVLEAIGWV